MSFYRSIYIIKKKKNHLILIYFFARLIYYQWNIINIDQSNLNDATIFGDIIRKEYEFLNFSMDNCE